VLIADSTMVLTTVVGGSILQVRFGVWWAEGRAERASVAPALKGWAAGNKKGLGRA